MPTDDTMRASDADREHAVGMLRDGFAAGRLTLAEFDERTTAAFTSRTWGELRELTKDLPLPGQRGFLPPAPVVPRPRDRGEQLPARAPHHHHGSSLRPALAIGLFWVMLTIGAHASGLLIPVVFLLLMTVLSAGRARCGPGSMARRPPGPPGPPDEQREQAP
jgi:Domain of unknown function (DUF1707)